MEQKQETLPQPLLLNIKQVMQVLGLGKTKIYDLIENEGLPVERFGKAVRFSYSALEQWIRDRHSQEDVA